MTRLVRQHLLRSGKLRSLRHPQHRIVLRAVVLALSTVVAATALTACGGSGPYRVTAVFQSAEGLFAGNSVDVLGVSKGTVTDVRPEAGKVVVTMAIDGSQALPAGVKAALTNPQLLGEPSIELSPGYDGGPRLAAGSVIPETRTSVPISTDQLLRDLQKFLAEVNPNAVGGVISNLASDLQGQGQGLNALIGQGAATLQLLANKGDALGQLNGSLAAISGTLRTQTSTITQLIANYDTVAGVLSANSGPLGDSITQLADASQQLATLLSPNLAPLQQDIGTITQVGRTLDRNLGSLDQGLSSSVALFTAAGRAYDPTYNWLNLNVAAAPGTTAAVIAGLVRDRLAGICRRVLAHAPALSQSAISTLKTCGNPNSGYFDPLLGAIPGILNSLPGQSGSPSAPTAQSLLSQGATEIPGISSSQRQAVSSGPGTTTTNQPANPMAGNPAINPAAPQPPPSSSGSGGLSGLLKGLIGAVHMIGSLL